MALRDAQEGRRVAAVVQPRAAVLDVHLLQHAQARAHGRGVRENRDWAVGRQGRQRGLEPGQLLVVNVDFMDAAEKEQWELASRVHGNFGNSADQNTF